MVEFIGEFGVELSTAIPFAYHLHTIGKLEMTKSVGGTRELYYFSPKHKMKTNVKRKPNDNIPKEVLPKGAKSWRSGERRYEVWKPPPYKTHFANDTFKFEKETLIIYNKYTTEWGKSQHNYIDIPTLETLCNKLKEKYKIVYIRFLGNEKEFVNDSQPIIKFKDMKLMERLKITTIQQLSAENPDMNINELQLKLMANCEKFISVQGGLSVLCSYFGGTNIIYHNKGHELEKGAYTGYFPKISGANIIVVTNYKDLLKNSDNFLK